MTVERHAHSLVRRLLESEESDAIFKLEHPDDRNIDVHIFLGQSGRGEKTVHLQHIQVKRDAPPGAGTRYMEELCAAADQFGWVITLDLGSPENVARSEWKKTSSTERLRRFYRRFGFNKKTKWGRYDLHGSWCRLPANRPDRRA